MGTPPWENTSSFNSWLAMQQQNIAHQNIAHQNALNQLGGTNGNWSAASQVHSSSVVGTNFSAGAINNLTQAQYSALISHFNAYDAPKPFESSIRVGEIIAYRMWLRKDDYLESYSAGRIWAPEEKMTGEPSDYGNEGIWAFKDKSRAIKKMLETPNAVYGSVKLWGKVIEHELGYRAECAKITSIDDTSCTFGKKNKILESLRRNYQLV